MFFKWIKDSFKIFIIYCISTIIMMVLTHFFVKNEYSIEEYKNYLIPFIVFSLMYVTLSSIYKVNKKILITSFILIFFLVTTLLIIDTFSISGLTPNHVNSAIINYGAAIALYTTLPYQTLIYILIGYNLVQWGYVVLAVYLIITIIVIYIIDYLKKHLQFKKIY